MKTQGLGGIALGVVAIFTLAGCAAGDGGDAAGITHVVTETVTVTAEPSAAADFDLCGTLEDLYAEHQGQAETPGSTELSEMYVTALSANGCQVPASPTPGDAVSSTDDAAETFDVCGMLEDAYQLEVDAGRVDEATEQYWTTMFDANGCQD